MRPTTSAGVLTNLRGLSPFCGMPNRHQHTIRTIEAAIASRLRLTLRYKDAVRVVEPHILGFDRQGHLALSAWQVSGTGEGWRFFRIDRIETLAAMDDRFHSAATGYNRNDPAFVTVLSQL